MSGGSGSKIQVSTRILFAQVINVYLGYDRPDKTDEEI